jgi:hypothetical protein
VCNGDSGGPIFGLVNGQRKLLGITSFGPSGCGFGIAVFTRITAFQTFLDTYGITRQQAVVPVLPALPKPSPVVTPPVLPSPVSTAQVVFPKFTSSRIFQLVLEKRGSSCLVEVDSPTTLRGYQVVVLIGRDGKKGRFNRILDEFGDFRRAVQQSCSSVRQSGVFLALKGGETAVRAVE